MIDGAWMVARLGRLGVAPGVALVGVSGGPDSLALLRLLHGAASGCGISLIVAHADHGIHPDSSRVADRVRMIASELSLPFEQGHLGLGPATSEAAARRARYAWFRDVLRRTGARYLFLAHHREDQAETILMRALAGSGPAGLAGMAPVRGHVVRPVLDVSRAELRATLTDSGWTPWEDPANRDPRHTRSWLRQEILPRLIARDPLALDRLLRVGVQAAANRRAWDSVLPEVRGLDLTMEDGAVSVAVTPLKGYDSALAHGVLRALVHRADVVASPGALQRLIRLVNEGSSGSWVPIGGRWRGELAFGRLRITAEPARWEPLSLALGPGAEGVACAGPWRLQWQHASAADTMRRDGWRTWLIPGVYQVRPWLPGDRIQPLGGQGTRLVVRCMQDRKVPRSSRDTWPVLVGEAGEVVWVPGVCRGRAHLPHEASEGVRIDVEQS